MFAGFVGIISMLTLAISCYQAFLSQTQLTFFVSSGFFKVLLELEVEIDKELSCSEIRDGIIDSEKETSVVTPATTLFDPFNHIFGPSKATVMDRATDGVTKRPTVYSSRCLSS